MIQDLSDLIKGMQGLERKARAQQMIYFKVISGLVALHQKHRVAKNYEVSDELRDLLTSVGVKIKQGTLGIPYDKIPESMKNMTVQDQWTIDTKDL